MRSVKSTPTSPSKADAGPKVSKSRNCLVANDLRQAAPTNLGDQSLEFCKASGRTPGKKGKGGPDFSASGPPIQSF
jgi:hypothetical protein